MDGIKIGVNYKWCSEAHKWLPIETPDFKGRFRGQDETFLQDRKTVKDRHTLRDMLRGREAGPFVCTHRAHVAATVLKLVHTKRILVHFYVVAGTVCKSSAHDTTLKIEIILSLLHDARIQTS